MMARITLLLLAILVMTASPLMAKPAPTCHGKSCPTPSPTASATIPLVGNIYGASTLFALDNATRDVGSAVAAGLNTIRIVNFLDESALGTPTDSTRWARVDNLIATAKANGLRIILDLSTYRNQLLAQGRNPYTTDWQPFLSFVMGRYANETAIAYYALAGEPAAPNSSDPRRPTTNELTSFYVRSTTQSHAIDLDTPVSSGGLLQYSWNSGIDYQAIFSGTDVAAIHVYSQQDESAAPTLASYAHSIGRPFVVEEFGFNQNAYSDSARASAFGRIYDEAATMGARGIAFWNLGPQVGGDTYDVNQQTPATFSAVQSNAYRWP